MRYSKWKECNLLLGPWERPWGPPVQQAHAPSLLGCHFVTQSHQGCYSLCSLSWSPVGCSLVPPISHFGCYCWLILCNKIIKHTKHFLSSDKRYFRDVHVQFFILIMYYKETLCSVLKINQLLLTDFIIFYFLFSHFSKFSMILPWFLSHMSYMFFKWFLWISKNSCESKLLLVHLCIVKDRFKKQLFEVKAQFSRNINV